MAETSEVLNITINTNDAVTAIQNLSKQNEILKQEAQDLLESEGELSRAYIKKTAEIKSNTAEIKSQQKVLVDYQKSENSVTGSIEQLRAKLSVVSKQWAALSEEERLNSEYGKKLTQDKANLTAALKAEEKATGDTRRNVGNYTDDAGKAATVTKDFANSSKDATKSTKGFSTGIGSVDNAFKLLSTNPIVAILTGIVATFTLLYKAMSRSEEGQNKLNKILAVGSVIMGNLMDIATSFGIAIVDAFTKPKEALSSLADGLKSFATNSIQGFADSFTALGNIIQGVFTLDWDKVTKSTSELTESFIQGLTGVDNLYQKVTDSVIGLVAETEKEISATLRLQDAKAQLDKQVRDNLIETAKNEKDIALLREQASQKDVYSAEQRAQFLNEAIELQNQIMEREISVAKEKARIHAEEMTFSESNKQDLEEQAQLEADIIRIESENADKRRTFKKQEQTFVLENMALIQKESELKVKIANEELKQVLLLNKTKVDSSRVLTDELVAEEKQRLDMIFQLQTEQYEKERELALSNKTLTESELALIDTEFKTQEITRKQENEANKQLLDDELKLQKEEQAIADAEAVALLEEESIAIKYEKMSAENENDYQIALAAQQRINRAENLSNEESEKRNLILKKQYAKQETLIKMEQANAQLGVASSLASSVAMIAGETSKTGKAAAIAATTITTLQSGISAFAGMVQAIPGPVGIIGGVLAAAGALASGYATIRKIVAVNPKSTSASSSPPTISVPSSVPSSAQATNTGNVEPNNVSSSVGNGIIQRDINSNVNNTKESQKVLVVDDVTFNQNNQSEQDRISTL